MDMPKYKSGIESRMVKTERLDTHVLVSGMEKGTPVIFIHGNFSAALYWQDLMLALPEGYYGIAPDLRGYGWSEDKRTDATRGVRDWSEDLTALMDEMEIGAAHFVGWSLGAAPIYRLMLEVPERIKSVTLVAPVSPYGFGGTKGLDGEPVFDDFAGCGGGLVNPDFVKRISEGDRSAEDPNSPRNIINTFYWAEGFVAEDIEDYLTASLMEKIGEDKYPGDAAPSENWPMAAPGKWGPINAGSPKYMLDDIPELLNLEKKPPVLWARGDKDQIVSDASFFDIPVLGKLGFVPGYPGEEVFPAQPMIGQTRAFFEKYASKGGTFEERVIDNAGHGCFIEKPEEFNAFFHAFLKSN
ncbi:MAG: alpha/beta hydrolase [Anaerolineaceae bacterium]|jgi:pimeloyl-ACP methyl ester carboxylesterase|nr:alpha/beta hydrolase [Anaerolineaceae bacterium]